jgi:fumarate hydratase class II
MMPGKVNPVIPEAVCQVAAGVIGNDAAITVGGLSGLLELNVLMPLLADSLLESLALLAGVSRLFARRCVAGIEADRARCRQSIEQSLALATALVPQLGYDAAARLAQRAYAEGRTVREAAEHDSGPGREEIDRLLDPARMAGPPG